MNRLFKLQNAIQPYAWGSHTAIAELMGTPTPSTHPQAEMWMGAHPKASSKIWYQGRWQSLFDLVRKDPVSFLGQQIVNQFGPQLPYLLKILAVEQPLSIQAHPSKALAEEGFRRENALRIPISAPNRNYRDNMHKPECLCAMTPFWALCGFREPKAIHALLDPVWPAERHHELDLLSGAEKEGHIRAFFLHLMNLKKAERIDCVSRVTEAIRKISHQDQAYAWTLRLNTFYPEDIGVLAPMLLNLLHLQPGQSIFLPAGCLHAYLNGMGVELMANSDNVLRGGLTPKYIDANELLRVLDFQWNSVTMVELETINSQEQRYPSKAAEFELAVLNVSESQPYTIENRAQRPEIMLCKDGSMLIEPASGGKTIELLRGESVFVPAIVDGYRIRGNALLYKAYVPQHPGI